MTKECMIGKKSTMDHKFARFLIYFKGFFGIFEFVLGIALLIIGPKAMNRYWLWILNFEPFEDHPRLMDSASRFVINHVLGSLHLLIALYMIIHGLVAIAVIFALIQKKMWAFPAAGLLLTLFILYQIYRLALAFSIILLILTLIDVAIIFFLRYEYKRAKLKLDEL
jgi:uncharacterized membrane protein